MPLPFVATDAQVRAMAEVDRRMEAAQPMNLLLQGDVGAGKTLVALHACLIAIQSGHQAAIMAPTEVLVGQHLRSVGALLDRIGGAVLSDASGRGSKEQESLFAGDAVAPDAHLRPVVGQCDGLGPRARSCRRPPTGRSIC